MPVGDLLHAREHGVAGDEHVAEQDVERLAGGLLRRAAHGVAEAERLLLVDVAHVHGPDALDLVGVGVLAARAEQRDQLGVGREVVLDRLLGPAVDDDDLVRCAGEPLLDHVLDGGTVDDEQHLLGLRLRGRKEAGAESRCGDESLHGWSFRFNGERRRCANPI